MRLSWDEFSLQVQLAGAEKALKLLYESCLPVEDSFRGGVRVLERMRRVITRWAPDIPPDWGLYLAPTTDEHPGLVLILPGSTAWVTALSIRRLCSEPPYVAETSDSVGFRCVEASYTCVEHEDTRNRRFRRLGWDRLKNRQTITKAKKDLQRELGRI